jgi:hypothetical protein
VLPQRATRGDAVTDLLPGDMAHISDSVITLNVWSRAGVVSAMPGVPLRFVGHVGRRGLVLVLSGAVREFGCSYDEVLVFVGSMQRFGWVDAGMLVKVVP